MHTFSESVGQQWPQFCQLVLAVGLSAAIGIERQLRHKSAGLRTNTLVGLGSALFMLVSKYGFTNVLEHSQVVLDPSRIAAQIVSGIGFIGGGIIFKQQSEVRGLTTAAAVWLTAAVGTACGGGLPILAALSTALYFVTVLLMPFIWHTIEKLRTKNAMEEVAVTIRYSSHNGGVEPVLDEILKSGVASFNLKRVDEVLMSALQSPVMTMDRNSARQGPEANSPLPPPMVPNQGLRRIFELQVTVVGCSSLNDLTCTLSRLESVLSVSINDDPVDEV